MQAQWPHHVILRSSIIYGPNSPQPVSRRLFLQFVDGALRDGPPTTFFADEWRSPVYACDICRIAEALLQLGMMHCRFLWYLFCDSFGSTSRRPGAMGYLCC